MYLKLFSPLCSCHRDLCCMYKINLIMKNVDRLQRHSHRYTYFNAQFISLNESLTMNNLFFLRTTTYATVRMINFDGDLRLHRVFSAPDAGLSGEFTLRARPAGGGGGAAGAFSRNGLLKAISLPDGETVPVHLDFIKQVMWNLHKIKRHI